MSASSERRALITGASSGIGKATALAFAQAGIHVGLLSRSQEKLAAVVQETAKAGVMAKAYPIDLAEIDQVKAKMQAIAADFGPIDILVNNAGIAYTKNIIDTPLSNWQKVIDLNLTSVFQCIQGVLPQMRDRHKGTIINVSSIAGQQVFPGWGAYCVSKFGLMALSKTLAAEERANGIRVSAICPGAVHTPLWDTETMDLGFDRSAMLTPETVAHSILVTALLPEQAVIEELTIAPSAGTL